MKEYTYQEQNNIENQKKLREVLSELPSFTLSFFRGIEPRTSSRTRLGYGYDLRIFFEFLQQYNPAVGKMKLRDIPMDILDQIKALDIEEYLEYLKLYEKDGKTITVKSAKERMESGKIALQAFKDFRESAEKDDQKAKNEARATFEKHKADFGYGYIEKADDLIPPTGLVYWSFRVMVGCGSLLLLILIGLWWQQRRGKLEQSKLLLHAGLWSIPLVYAAGQAGWIVAEVGRQPWAIQDLLPVNAAISGISAGAVQTTFFIFLAIFTVLLACEVRILCRAIKGHNAE